jgi:hypothetical protein
MTTLSTPATSSHAVSRYATPGRAATIAGWVVTGLFLAFMVFDTVGHLLNIEPVREATERLGQPAYLPVVIGAIQVVVITLYVVPRTAVLGAVLWTGYFGGAIAVNLSTEQPFAFTAFAFVTCVAGWVGLALRDRRALRLFA